MALPIRITCLGLIALALLLGACMADTIRNEDGILPDPPPDAIRVEEDLYMVPVAVDESGCQQYSAWSRQRMVPTVIYYRKANGEFTMFRSEADCNDS